VPLRYEFPQGRHVRYRWTINATTSIDSTLEQRRDRVAIVMEVDERVLGQSNEGNAQVRMVLDPIEFKENGVDIGTPEATVLDYEVSAAGRIARVVRSAHLPPAALQELEVDTLLGEVLPPLPERSVEINDRWDAPLKIAGKRSNIDLTGRGRLAGFRLKNQSRRARISVSRTGSISTSQKIGRALTDIAGTSRVRTTAEIDLDRHLLAESNSRSQSTFNIATGGAPQGTVELVLVSRVELI
jgi:hypothetical protein